VVAFEGAVVAFFVDAAVLLGVPKSVAAIYGLVFASPVPLTFSEITSRLDFSNGSVSQGLRVLKEIGALKGQASEGDRLERFTPDLELRKLIARFLEHRLDQQLKSGSQRLKGLKQMIPAGTPETTEELTDRLRTLSDWHKRARQLVPVARAFLKLS
jgi:DNA-binding transcriptional regulator GbsR (MarR family)